MALEIARLLAEAQASFANAVEGNPAAAATIANGWEKQNVVIAGDPSSGTFDLSFTPAGESAIEIAAIPFDATGAELQALLRAETGLEFVTVATSGTAPNLTHEITLAGQPGRLALIVADDAALNQGTVTVELEAAGTIGFEALYLSILQQLDAVSISDLLKEVVAAKALSDFSEALTAIATNVVE